MQVRDENGNQIADYGLSIQRPRSPIEEELIEDHPSGIFSYSFPLIFKFSGRESTVGDVTLYSSFDTIFGRIEIGIFFSYWKCVNKNHLFGVSFYDRVSHHVVRTLG